MHENTNERICVDLRCQSPPNPFGRRQHILELSLLSQKLVEIV
jgi:hypothetical protein